MTPFTYKTLAEELEKIPDLIVSMGSTIYGPTPLWDTGTWRRTVYDHNRIAIALLVGPTVSVVALCWALYLHSASDDDVTVAVRGWRPSWNGYSTAAMVRELTQPQNREYLWRLGSLFLTETDSWDVQRAVGDLIKVYDPP